MTHTRLVLRPVSRVVIPIRNIAVAFELREVVTRGFYDNKHNELLNESAVSGSCRRLSDHDNADLFQRRAEIKSSCFSACTSLEESDVN